MLGFRRQGLTNKVWLVLLLFARLVSDLGSTVGAISVTSFWRDEMSCCDVSLHELVVHQVAVQESFDADVVVDADADVGRRQLLRRRPEVVTVGPEFI